MALSIRANPLTFISFHRITGNLFFLVLLIYSIVYAAERIIYVDSAWVFFKQVNDQSFACSWERFAAFISEIPLFVAVKLHLPFKVLVYIFSAGFIVLYYLIWRLCTYKLKNQVAGLLIILGMIMGVRETFLHTITETHQVLVYSALLFALIQAKYRNLFFKSCIVCSVTIFVRFTHPLGLFTSGFVLLYYFIEKRNFKEILI